MKAKWKRRGNSSDLPYLLVDSGPSIKQLYIQNRHLLKGKGVLVAGIDGPSLLSEKDKEIFSNQLKALRIPFQSVGTFLWIQAEEVNNLFEKSDFGNSADICFFITKQPDDFQLLKTPRIKGLFHKTFPKEILNIFQSYKASDIIYIINDIPDLLVVTKDEELLGHIDDLIQVDS